MEKILEGILYSQKDRKVKHAMVQRIRSSGQEEQSIDSIHNMLRTTSTIILRFDAAYSVDACKDIYKMWATFNRSSLSSFIDEKFVKYLLTNDFPNYSCDAIWILRESFGQLQIGSPGHLQELYPLVQLLATEFFHDHPQHPAVTSFCAFLQEFPHCIPQSHHTAPFCDAIILSVASFEAPKNRAAMVKYITNVNRTIGGFLDHLWKHSDRSCMLHCLRTIFEMISFVDSSRQVSPSTALAGIVQYLPADLIDNVAKDTTGSTSISDENLQSAVISMMDWLPWPYTKNIDLWTVAFLRGLAAASKYKILVEVAELTIDNLFSSLEYEIARRNCFIVLEHLLLGFQHSPDLFHKIVGQVPSLIKTVCREKSPEPFLSKLSELMHTLMHQYPGFPDLYEPVLTALQGQRCPSSEVIKRRLSQTEWTGHKESSLDSHAALATSFRLAHRSETGKAGLVNLGNTCYMNSVIQALYMCDSFRHELLTAKPGVQQSLLIKLQHVFAFLSATQRAAAYPTQFVKASRPPWFTAGHQQDCSEYLRHLLDQLHEQELDCLLNEAKGVTRSPKHRRFKRGGKSPEPEAAQNSDLAAASTLIQKTFGGRVLNVYRCLKCKTESSCFEKFTDIPLAFPGDQKERSQPKWSLPGGATSRPQHKGSTPMDDKPQAPITLDELINFYLSPERLEGENKYHCEKCKGKQDGERVPQIVECPEYLILTLLRFAYNVKTQSRSKILADVCYPKVLEVPTCPEAISSNGKKQKTSKGSVQAERYALAAVVVHSGYSSDGGHYYCYARHCFPAQNPPGSSNADLLQDRWYMFNDNRVTYSSYESFSSVTQKFAKDTVYVLVYKRIRPKDVEHSMDWNLLLNPPLRRDLREAVDMDNKKFLQEQELQERNRALQRQRSAGLSPGGKWYDRRDDNNGPPGSCGGGGMGGFQPKMVF